MVEDPTQHKGYQEALERINEAKKSNAESLDLGALSLQAIPPEISTLASLTQLVLSSNQLSELPDWFKNLTNLSTLHLSLNQLSELPDGFQKLTNLSSLYLSSNQLSELPEWFQKLTNLSSLHLRGNQLTELPDWFQNLTNLSSLSLDDNQLTELPDWFQKLTNLSTLSLSNTGLTELPEWFQKLTSLSTLYLSSNQLTELPDWFQNLTNLSTLYLDGNQLTELPDWFQNLTNLSDLDLRNNGLTEVPDWFQNLTNLSDLDLRINPSLPLPPEIVENWEDAQSILSYIASLQAPADQLRALNEAKIILVGQGAVGKTSLVNRLVHGTFRKDEEKTPGVMITDWTVPDGEEEIEVHIWDFGGQEIMHATHQFFLTRRSLYLLVLDCRLSEEDNRLDYWMELIQTYGQDSPVIVVGNKVDQHPLELDQTGLRKKYPIIREFIATSAETTEGLDKLKDLIFRYVPLLPNVKDSLPVSWFDLKEELENIDSSNISYKEYKELCKKHGVEDKNTQENVLRFLHELGVVFAFGEKEDVRLSLQNTQVLNPNWVTKGVYKVLNDTEHEGGIFGWPDLRRVLTTPDYPEDLHRNFIMELMGKFERSYSWGKGRHEKFLVPDLFSKDEVDTGNWDDALKFEYHYDVLLPGLISRIMVRHHEEMDQNLSWRSGAVFTNGENETLIQADKARGTIKLAVRGNPLTQKDYLALLCMDIDRINRRLNITPRQYIPIPGYPDINVDYQHALNLVEMGEKDIIPPGLMKRIDLSDLLSRYRSLRVRQDEAAIRRMEEWREEQDQRDKEFREMISEVGKKVDRATKDLSGEKKLSTAQKWVWQFIVLILGAAFLIWMSSEIQVDPYILIIEIVIVIVLATFLLTQQEKMEGKEAAGIFKSIAEWIGKINPFFKAQKPDLED